MRKKIKLKKFLFFLPIIIGGLWIYFNNLHSSLVDFYYFKINPKAGVKRLEKTYKELFQIAETARDQANLTITEMQDQAKDINALFSYQGKIRGFFSKRDAAFQEMLRIDEKAKQINISEEYREFFRRRQLADKNEYEAFRIYREGMENIMEGTLAYLKFEQFHRQALALFTSFILNPEESFTGENLKTFKTLTDNLELQFQEILSLQKRKVYSEELVEDIRERKEIVQLFQQVNEAILEEDEEKVKETFNTISQRIKQREKKEVSYKDLGLQWIEEISRPIFEAQDKKHKESLDLYNQAYIYARTQNLKEILSVWNNHPPGTIEENFEKS